jgi:Resolvase, N terminal domain
MMGEYAMWLGEANDVAGDKAVWELKRPEDLPSLIKFVMDRVRAGAESAARKLSSICTLCMTAFHLTRPGQKLESTAVRRAVGPFVVRSSESWKLIKLAYDDRGMSGGTMERPALQRLLADIGEGLVDVVVVYKVDRLTRALAAFAKMVEMFDARVVSFVAVTLQFNTTTSMGRLTLNVLLSFAQFEREVTGERIRDKIAASKRKGMWMGGVPPLGYEVRERRLVVNPTEANISPWQVVWPRVVVIAGLSMLFAPLNVAAFIYLPKEIRGAAVGLLALLRNEGGSVGTSVAQIIQERREQFHTLRVNESLDPLNPPVNTLLTRGQAFFLQHNGDAVLSHQMALGVLGQSRAQQASSLAYFDVFSFSAAVGVLLVAFVLLMRRSVAEKGAHIGGE